MEVRADAGKFFEVEADALVVLIFEGESPTEGVLGEVNEKAGGLISELLGSDELRGKKLYDKRETEMKRTIERETRAALKERR